MSADVNLRIQALIDLAKKAEPVEDTPCSQLTLDEDLSLIRYYKAVRPSRIIALLAEVAGYQVGASGDEIVAGVGIHNQPSDTKSDGRT